jgi:ABC-type branched-subunit amino acid transport system substrate-binding protein
LILALGRRRFGLALVVALASGFTAATARPEGLGAEDAPASPAPVAEPSAARLVSRRTLEGVLDIAPGQTPEWLRQEAESARQHGERFRGYALVTLARRAAEASGRAREKESRRLADRQREWTRDLFPEEAACAAAWCGITPELSLQYARRTAELGHGDDAAAEALSLLAADGVTAKARADAASLLASVARTSSTRLPRGGGGVHASVYRVAAVLPLSGDYGVYGRSLLAGLRLALEDSLAPRGALPVRVEEYDAHADPVAAAAAAREALDAGSGIVVGEALSLPTFVLAGICRERGVALLSPSATDERIGELGPLVLQTGLSRAAQAWALAEHVAGEAGVGHTAVPEPRDADAAEFATAFRAAAESLGMETVEATTPSGRRDAPRAIDALRNGGAEALLLPAEAGAAELWLAGLGKVPTSLRLLASEALDVASLSAEARSRLEGLTLVGLEYALPESVFVQVDAAAQARFGVAADRFVRRGYLTGRAIARALRQRAASPAQLAAALVPSGPQAVRTGGASRHFVVFSAAEAAIPILVWRRGKLVRVR